MTRSNSNSNTRSRSLLALGVALLAAPGLALAADGAEHGASRHLLRLGGLGVGFGNVGPAGPGNRAGNIGTGPGDWGRVGGVAPGPYNRPGALGIGPGDRGRVGRRMLRIGGFGLGRGNVGVAGARGVNRIGAVGVGPGDRGIVGGVGVAGVAPRYAAIAAAPYVVAPNVVPVATAETTAAVAVGCGQQVVAAP